MISESKYSKNGVIASASPSATNPNIKHSANATLNHQHLNLHHHQYNQPSIKSIINYNNNSVNDSSISTRDYTNSSYDAFNNNVITKTNNDSASSNHHQHQQHHRQNNNKHLNSCSSSSTSSTGSVNVKFTGFFKDKIDEREKYLTAKYPNHQMALIKKRLKVEFWIDEQLKNLFNITVGLVNSIRAGLNFLMKQNLNRTRTQKKTMIFVRMI